MHVHRHEVTLKGEWERESTRSWEITDTRKALYGKAPVFGVRFHSITASRPDETGNTRYGKFKATVVWESPLGCHRDTRERALATARLKLLLKEMTCIPPKVVNVELVEARSTSRRLSDDEFMERVSE